MSVNLNGAFYMARAAVQPMLVQRWGRLIGVTTSFHTMIRGHVTPYGPSKAGHEAFVSNAAFELEGTGVTANVIVPGGAADTNLAGDAATTPAEERAKLIRPEVMGPPAVWLASDAADACNGMRFVAIDWDESLAIAERIEKAGAPVAWPQLGKPIPRGVPPAGI
jgi:3-oxoacyl-[acyl-carrier protein] reductase